MLVRQSGSSVQFMSIKKTLAEHGINKASKLHSGESKDMPNSKCYMSNTIEIILNFTFMFDLFMKEQKQYCISNIKASFSLGYYCNETHLAYCLPGGKA